MIWHSNDRAAVLKELGVDDKKGLPNGVADMRLEKYGKNIISDSDIIVSGDKNVEITSAARITAHIVNGVDTEAGIEVILQDDELQYTTKGAKSTFTVKGNKASFNGGENRGVVNIAQIESLVKALQKDLLIASSGSNLSSWMASEMPKMEDKKLSH